MKGALLDTSALYAAADDRETDHAAARSALDSLAATGSTLILTDVVVAELHGLALRRVRSTHALELIERVIASPRVEIVGTGPDVIERAVVYLRSRPGRDYSLTDAISFLVMKERGIDTAFTLDADFQAEGFATIP